MASSNPRSAQAEKQSIPRTKELSTPFDSIPINLRQTYADRIYCCTVFPEEGPLGMSYTVIQWDEIANCLNHAFAWQDSSHNSREIWQSDTENDDSDEGSKTKNQYLRIGRTKIATYRDKRIDGETVREILEYMLTSERARRVGNPRPAVQGYDSNTTNDWVEAWCHSETTEAARQCIKDRSLGWGEFDISAAERQRRYFPPPFPVSGQLHFDYCNRIALGLPVVVVSEEVIPEPAFERDPEKMIWK